MKTFEQIKKSERVINLLEKKGNPKLINDIAKLINTIGRSLPDGFSLERNGHDDHVVSFSLFYKRRSEKRRIAVFSITKILAEKINEKIKRFRKNNHK